MMTGETVIEIHEITKSFGQKQVLKGISGTIRKGTVVGILGRNGEGKTTLFKIMIDLLAADAGKVSILGLIPDGSARIRQKVGYIPEKPSFHEFMTLEEVLEFRERFYPSWNREKAAAMTRQLELDLTTQVRGASKGTLSKIAWICAAAHCPQVFLLDEPTSGLDPVVRDAVLTQIVREMSDEGKTIVVTSHHMEELMGVLDEIWILAEGRIQNVYPLEYLRQNALRIAGRLKRDGKTPGCVTEESRVGDLVQWVVLSKEALSEIQSYDLLENMQTEPLPVDTAFRILLSRQREPI